MTCNLRSSEPDYGTFDGVFYARINSLNRGEPVSIVGCSSGR